METFIFGDSHAGTLVKAKADAYAKRKDGSLDMVRPVRVDNGTIALEFMLSVDSGNKILNPILAKNLSDFGLMDRFSGTFNLQRHNLVMLFGFGEVHVVSHNSAWRNYSFRPNGGKIFLQPEILVEMFRVRYQTYLSGVRYLKERGARLFVMTAPPPHKSNDFILKHLTGLKVLPEPEVRLAAFQAMRTVMEEWCREIQVEMIDFTSLLADSAGFLRAEFEGDGVHGNLHCGKFVLNLLREDPRLSAK